MFWGAGGAVQGIEDARRRAREDERDAMYRDDYEYRKGLRALQEQQLMSQLDAGQVGLEASRLELADAQREAGNAESYRGLRSLMAGSGYDDATQQKALAQQASVLGDDAAYRTHASLLKQAEEEGVKDFVKYARMGYLPEAVNSFNRTGKDRLASLDYDPSDNKRNKLIYTTPDGRQGVLDLTAIEDAISPSEYASAGDGFIYNKRTGQAKDIGGLAALRQSDKAKIYQELKSLKVPDDVSLQGAYGISANNGGANGPDGKPLSVNQLDLLWRRTFNFPDEQTLQNMEMFGQQKEAEAIRQKMSENPLTEWIYNGYGVDLRPKGSAIQGSKKPYPWQEGGDKARAGQDAPPMEGARKAPDGKWYVQKDGKYYMVTP